MKKMSFLLLLMSFTLTFCTQAMDSVPQGEELGDTKNTLNMLENNLIALRDDLDTLEGAPVSFQVGYDWDSRTFTLQLVGRSKDLHCTFEGKGCVSDDMGSVCFGQRERKQKLDRFVQERVGLLRQTCVDLLIDKIQATEVLIEICEISEGSGLNIEIPSDCEVLVLPYAGSTITVNL